MNTFHERLKVFCRDGQNEHEILYPDYEETDNEIKIKTPAKNSGLYRGWIGDLVYMTKVSRDALNPNECTNLFAEEIYRDVLLISVKILVLKGDISWEYTFLKK